MPKVSPKKVTKEGVIINDFWRTVTLLANKEEVRDFFKAVLTSTEMLMLAKRLEIAKMLIHGCSYREIRRETKVSNATINHVQRSLIRGSYFGLLNPLQRLEDYDAKIRKSISNKLHGKKKLIKTTLSQKILKVAVIQGVKQYEKWRKFESARD